MHHHCINCHTPYPEGFQPFCSLCGEMVDVTYDLSRVQLNGSDNPYIRFADLLPIQHLHHRLPKTSYTPTVHAKNLGRELGMSALYLKNETVLPTCSTKDRMAVVSLAYLHERGVRTFCTSSTGNSSTAYAYSIQAHPDMRLVLFTAENFVSRVQYANHAQVTHFGLRNASFVDAFNYAGAYAQQHGLVSERGFFNPGRREGLKLAFLEASEQIPQAIDWYVQAVSSAMGVYGVYKGAKELLALRRLSRLPRLLCVQQESCAPMATAFAAHSDNITAEHLVAKPTGIAEAILRGDPTRAYPHIRRIVMDSNGGFVSVNEAEIRTARKQVEDYEGISPCFSAATAVAGLSKLARNRAIGPSAVVLINLTGGDRPAQPETSSVTWL